MDATEDRGAGQSPGTSPEPRTDPDHDAAPEPPAPAPQVAGSWPDVYHESAVYDSLPGAALFDYDRWVCPRGDYTFPVIDAADPLPDMCPNDGSALEFRAAGA